MGYSNLFAVVVAKGSDVRLQIIAPHSFVFVARPGVKAELDMFAKPDVTGLFTFDRRLTWPDRVGYKAASQVHRMMPGPSIDVTWLACVLGMLGSEHAGECDTAALMAEKIRREAWLQWIELLAPTVSRIKSPAPPDASADVQSCMPRPDLLTEGEIRFIGSIRLKPSYRLSPKQRDTLAKIAAEVRVGMHA